MSGTPTVTPPSLETANAKIAELDKRLEESQTLAQQRTHWANYRDLLLLVTSHNNGNRNQENPAVDAPSVHVSPEGTTPRKRSDTGNVAYEILRSHGELSTRALVEKMRAVGWEGSGEDRVDKNRIYVALHRQQKRFEKTEKGWRARK